LFITFSIFASFFPNYFRLGESLKMRLLIRESIVFILTHLFTADTMRLDFSQGALDEASL